jgi:ferritin-like metal-binding protein YciE
VLDAAVLTAILKLKHYKIATYNAMKNLANNLHLQNEVLNTLQESLNEVNNADKILERIFEKSLNNFSTSQREPAGAGGFGNKNRN